MAQRWFSVGGIPAINPFSHKDDVAGGYDIPEAHADALLAAFSMRVSTGVIFTGHFGLEPPLRHVNKNNGNY